MSQYGRSHRAENGADQSDARALFERSTIKMPADKIRPLWDLWAKYEYMYGDLTAVHKLEKRWAEAFPNGAFQHLISAC